MLVTSESVGAPAGAPQRHGGSTPGQAGDTAPHAQCPHHGLRTGAGGAHGFGEFSAGTGAAFELCSSRPSGPRLRPDKPPRRLPQ